ncbi:MAG: septum formation initiator family protein [Patescibacteria group bacterium]
MRNFQQKRGFRNILHSRPFLVLFGILIFVFAYGVVGFMSKMQATIEKRKLVENKVIELQKKKETLSANIAKLQTESGVEESIRDKFGLAKEGEGAIIIVEDKNVSEAPPKKLGGFFSFFINLFK